MSNHGQGSGQPAERALRELVALKDLKDECLRVRQRRPWQAALTPDDIPVSRFTAPTAPSKAYPADHAAPMPGLPPPSPPAP
jgi:hypothetical protein